LKIDLENPRVPLVVDASRQEKKKIERPKSRANWLQLQEERMAKEQEMNKKTDQMKKDLEMRIERDAMIFQNMERVIQQ
jgi:hypothetical protein